MNPIYKFIFDDDGTDLAVFPTYGSNNAMSFEKEGGQEFFRRKLSGQLKFTGPDYAYIVAQAFDHEFKMQMQISYDRGQTWTPYWNGKFYKTDCEFNDDDKVVTVTPTTDDDYNAVIAGLEKEFDLISLAPEIVPVKMDKRPMIQVYIPGESSIGCFLSGMWWEQECTPESNESALVNDFFFALADSERVIDISQTGLPTIPVSFSGAKPETESDTQDFVTGAYKFHFEHIVASGGSANYWQIIRVSDNQVMWQYAQTNVPPPSAPPLSITLQPVSGSGATGTVDLYIHDINVYSRYVCDVDSIAGVQTNELPDNDIVENNRNYSRVIGYAFPDTIFFSSRTTSTPTEWGLYQPGEYYEKPYIPGISDFFPIARNSWGAVSVWFSFYAFDWLIEREASGEFTLRHAYPIASVISVLLGQIAPDITHEDSTDYSRFLYAENDPLTGVSHHLFITPKSNLVNAGYDQPAQKAPIKLADVLNMLRDCYRCYWFIDEEKRFRIEHIEFFRRGGSYSSLPSVGIDLTAMLNPRNGKPWSFDTTKYKFEKPAMAARYQFGWMDDVTKPFNGSPIDILSGYVDPNKIEQISVGNFTSDVDYILLNPAAISQDGFALICGLFIQDTPMIQEFDLNSYDQQTGKLAANGKWNDVTDKYIVVPVTAGQRLKITGGSTYDAQLAWFVSNSAPIAGEDAPLVPGTSRFTLIKNRTEYYIVPDGANYLYVYSGWGAMVGLYLPSFAAQVEYPSQFYVPYVNIDGAILQNGPLAFAYLQIYYNWDMPAKNYTIDGFPFQATGVKKLKTQSVSFPCYRDPDMQKLVKTLMGNGMLEKLSLNLCSRFADATLRYDTE